MPSVWSVRLLLETNNWHSDSYHRWLNLLHITVPYNMSRGQGYDTTNKFASVMCSQQVSHFLAFYNSRTAFNDNSANLELSMRRWLNWKRVGSVRVRFGWTQMSPLGFTLVDANINAIVADAGRRASPLANNTCDAFLTITSEFGMLELVRVQIFSVLLSFLPFSIQ